MANLLYTPHGWGRGRRVWVVGEFSVPAAARTMSVVHRIESLVPRLAAPSRGARAEVQMSGQVRDLSAHSCRLPKGTLSRRSRC